MEGSFGDNSQWVVTDANGYILGLPPSPGSVDFDAAGEGLCFVHHVSFKDGMTGLAAGNNIGDLQGCFDISNGCLLYTSPSPRDQRGSRMPSSA